MGPLDRIKRLSEQGDKDTVQRELVAFLRKDPRNVDAWWMLAQVLLDPRKKIEAYRHILTLDPDHMEAARQFAVLTLPPGEPLEASEEYQKALAEYYKKKEAMPPLPEPDKPTPGGVPIAADDTAVEKPASRDAGSPLDNVQRAFPIQKPRNVGELQPVQPEAATPEVQPTAPVEEDIAASSEVHQSAPVEDEEFAWMEALEPAEISQQPEGLEFLDSEDVEDALGIEDAEQLEAATEPQLAAEAQEPEVQTPEEDVDTAKDEDEYPEELKRALKDMRLQQGLRKDDPRPNLWKAAQTGLRPDMMRTNFVSDALESTPERRMQDLADGNMDTLEPLDADKRIQCPNCQATIAKDAARCEWCGEKLTSDLETSA